MSIIDSINRISKNSIDILAKMQYTILSMIWFYYDFYSWKNLEEIYKKRLPNIKADNTIAHVNIKKIL